MFVRQCWSPKAGGKAHVPEMFLLAPLEIFQGGIGNRDNSETDDDFNFGTKFYFWGKDC